MTLDEIYKVDDPEKFLGALSRWSLELTADRPFESLPTGAKRILRIQELVAEVNNGSFHGYFCNDSGENAHEAYEDLLQIGAAGTADLAKRAMSVFPDERVPKDRSERVDLLEEVEDRPDVRAVFNETLRAFYPDDLSGLMATYFRAHPEEFQQSS
jgi:hypothetical protein